MKNTIKHTAAFIAMLLVFACNNDENEIVPDFLDGTAYGVLLDVNVTSALEVPETDLDNYALNFEVMVKGDNSPVASILVNKTFVNGEDGKASTVPQESLSQFPQTINLTSADLVEGFSGLSVADVSTTDSFNVSFVITYTDGRIVNRFDTSMRTNFTVLITE